MKKRHLILGSDGNGVLYGGAGNDTLMGDGFDTVLDSDGLGVINIGSIEAKGSAGLDPVKWKLLSPDTLMWGALNDALFDSTANGRLSRKAA